MNESIDLDRPAPSRRGTRGLLQVLRISFVLIAVWQVAGLLPVLTWVDHIDAVRPSHWAMVATKLVLLTICIGCLLALGAALKQVSQQPASPWRLRAPVSSFRAQPPAVQWTFAVGMSIAVYAAYTLSRDNYADCILKNMPGAANQPFVSAVIGSCMAEHGQHGFLGVEQGAGLWPFAIIGYRDSQSCVMAKAKDVRHDFGARQITMACQKLYDKPNPFSSFPAANDSAVVRPDASTTAPPITMSSEMAQPGNGTVTLPSGIDLSTTSPAPSAKVVTAPAQRQTEAHWPPVPRPAPEQPEKQPSRMPTEQELAAARDLAETARRAVEQYPFLDTPEGAETLRKIVQRRDEFIRAGTYPSIALQRAINAFAPYIAEQLAGRNAPAPVATTATPEPPQQSKEGCRWATPQDWVC